MKSSNDFGLWSVDSDGSLVKLLREGDKIGNQTLKSFTALSIVRGSPAQSRTFNADQQITVRAHFTDHSVGLVRIAAP